MCKATISMNLYWVSSRGLLYLPGFTFRLNVMDIRCQTNRTAAIFCSTTQWTILVLQTSVQYKHRKFYRTDNKYGVQMWSLKKIHSSNRNNLYHFTTAIYKYFEAFLITIHMLNKFSQQKCCYLPSLNQTLQFPQSPYYPSPQHGFSTLSLHDHLGQPLFYLSIWLRSDTEPIRHRIPLLTENSRHSII